MAYDYKVVPFIGQSKGSLSAEDIARQLESTICQHATQGWEFYQLTDVNIEVRPGCVAGMFGAKVQYVRFDQLVFRASRTRSHVERSGAPIEHPRRNTEQLDQLGSMSSGLPVTTRHLEAWREKTDEEVLNAATNLQNYTEEGRAIIRAELARRSLGFPEGDK